jgi:hypothetical protein
MTSMLPFAPPLQPMLARLVVEALLALAAGRFVLGGEIRGFVLASHDPGSDPRPRACGDMAGRAKPPASTDPPKMRSIFGG